MKSNVENIRFNNFLNIMKLNHIVIVEDDAEDGKMLIDTFRELGVIHAFRCFKIPSIQNYLLSIVFNPFWLRS